ncbi:Protein of unknown function [Gryllus bimaculatus]|nr:Protein of unknown function [Gryllus bimaculatus]
MREFQKTTIQHCALSKLLHKCVQLHVLAVPVAIILKGTQLNEWCHNDVLYQLKCMSLKNVFSKYFSKWNKIFFYVFNAMQMPRFTSVVMKSALDPLVTSRVGPQKMIPSRACVRHAPGAFLWYAMFPLWIALAMTFLWPLCLTVQQ